MDETLTQIEKYLAGQLTQEEVTAFEQRLKVDPEFAQEVRLFKDMTGGIRLHNNRLLKNRLNEIHAQEIDQPQQAVVRRIPWKAIAAAIALLIIASVYFLNNTSLDAKALYAENFVPSEVEWGTRGADINQVALVKAQQLYKANNYTELQQLIAVDSLQATFSGEKFTIMKGIVELEQSRFDAARNFFKQAERNPLLQAEAQWYLALSYLKEDQPQVAKQLLEQLIKDTTSDYYEEADELLKEL